MLTLVHRIFEGMPPLRVLGCCLLSVAVIGFLDHASGFELSFSIFYLGPVAVASWYAGRGPGRIITVASTATWLLMDYTAGHEYTHVAIPFWNAAVRFAFFSVTAHLLLRLKLHLEREEELARVDALTGTMNSRFFRETAKTVLELAGRHGHTTVLGYVDVDNFKTVNDTLGHAAGDRVLKSIATALTTGVRRTDFVGRLGGDEFAVLLPETTRRGAERVFHALRPRLRRAVEHPNLPVGFSVGVAIFPAPPPTVEDAIRLADSLMYRAKAAGKDAVLFEEIPAG